MRVVTDDGRQHLRPCAVELDQLGRWRRVGREQVGLDQEQALLLEEAERSRRAKIDRRVGGNEVNARRDRFRDDGEEAAPGDRAAASSGSPASAPGAVRRSPGRSHARLSQTSYTQTSMERALTSADVERLATLVDLRIPEEDLELLARALEAHAELVEPLLRLDPSTTESALTFNPSPDA